jgi:hypothetical protein
MNNSCIYKLIPLPLILPTINLNLYTLLLIVFKLIGKYIHVCYAYKFELVY